MGSFSFPSSPFLLDETLAMDDGDINGSSQEPAVPAPVGSGAFGKLDSLQRPRSIIGGWKACSFIVGVELLERFSHHGIASNLVTYLTTVLHESTATAAKHINNFQGTSALVPIVGGFVADAYWGRYKTSLVGCVVYVLGLVCLTFVVSLPSLRPPSCANSLEDCQAATDLQLGFFLGALYLTTVGLGATTPCFEAFGADQFQEGGARDRRRKSSFFNWWFFAVSIGSLTASTALVYIQEDVSWGLGFGIPCVTMTVALLTFAAGTRYYIRRPPGGSPLTRVAQVLVATVRKWDVQVPEGANLLFEVPNEEHLRHGRRRLLPTPDFRYLHKAAVMDKASLVLSRTNLSEMMPSTFKDDPFLGAHLLSSEATDVEQTPSQTFTIKLAMVDLSLINPWRLCTVTQVEEVKLVLRIIPVILATLIYGMGHAQATTLFLRQGSTLNRNLTSSFKMAPASMQLFSFAACMVAVMAYDQVLVPIARRLTGNERGITLLQRMGVGMFLTALCMAIAAVTEMARLKVAKDNDLLDDPSVSLPMSIFWLVPQYVLIGTSNVFTVVGKQEFFYDQVPDTMRSLGMAIYLLTSGTGAYLSSFLISLVEVVTTRNGGTSWFVSNLNRCHLDYFYWLLAVLTAANMGVYVMVAKNFTYKRAENPHT